LQLLKQHLQNNAKVNTSKCFFFFWSSSKLFFFCSLKLSNLTNESLGECSCIVESDENQSHHYLIYSINDRTNKKILFGQLFYQIHPSDNLYTIIIGQKLYKVQSSDLKNRRLAIIDIIPPNINDLTNFNYPETLFQVIDSFSKTNQKYHVTIHDKEWALGYLAMTILLHLHESQRNDFWNEKLNHFCHEK
jgi:hypothetical protein